MLKQGELASVKNQKEKGKSVFPALIEAANFSISGYLSRLLFMVAKKMLLPRKRSILKYIIL